MTDMVVLVADSGEDAGLGHISRTSAVAVALRCRGIETRCYAFGVEDRFERDGIEWTPIAEAALPDSGGGVLLVDSYRLPHDELARAAASSAVVLMYDRGDIPEGAAFAVSTSLPPPIVREKHLFGLEYAALRPMFWGLPRRVLRRSVEHVLVTVGSGLFAELGSELAAAVAAALPDAQVTLVRGPYAADGAPAGVALLDAPDSLLDALLHTDLAVSASGQTMLEAAATGTPCVAFPLIDNQRAQVLCLAERGGVRLIDPPDTSEIAVAAIELARSIDARRELSLNGQRSIDGYGALRVAFHVAQLAGRRRAARSGETGRPPLSA